VSGGRTIVYAPEAARELDALDAVMRGRIESALTSLALDPLAQHNQIKRLKGDTALRLRVGGASYSTRHQAKSSSWL
jgi:mRNA-degrading endonuclease RelE of RelBE toxin-antitoxin system